MTSQVSRFLHQHPVNSRKNDKNGLYLPGACHTKPEYSVINQINPYPMDKTNTNAIHWITLSRLRITDYHHNNHQHPYFFRYLRADLQTYDLNELDCKFDVILIDPPLEEYQRRDAGVSFNWKSWSWEEVGISVFWHWNPSINPCICDTVI